ncbi:MAG TPA: methyltransferase domain-containing protein [Solirubrobacteraceae bacterium]|jgi:SAM-dependent methyltransferase|nr:methyltransferase domain-containing protein [Solirubrobacteraceae bacterium]
MASLAASVPAAVERALALFEPGRLPASVRLRDGYLELLEDDQAARPHLAQRILNSRVTPAVYEWLGHPLAMRLAGGFRAPVRRKEQRLAVEMLRLSGGQSVLDIACGPGNFTRTYANLAGDALVVGLDLSRTMLAAAVRRTPGANVAYMRANACSLPFRASSYPAVSCFGAMHLFEEPMQGLAEMVRVLEPGGRLALMTSCGSDRKLRRDGWHVFRRDEITGALSAHGLTGIEQRVTGRLQFVSAHKPEAGHSGR